MVIVNEQGRIAMVNQQTEKMFGFARGELEGQTLKMLMPERFRLEVLGLHKSGRELAVEISLSPWKTKSGLLVVKLINDMLDLTRAKGDKMELSPVESDVGKGSTFSVILPVNTRRLPDHTRNGCHCEEVGTPIETTLPYSLSHEYPHR